MCVCVLVDGFMTCQPFLDYLMLKFLFFKQVYDF